MSRDPVEAVAPAVDVAALKRRVRQAHVALQDAERRERTADEALQQARDEAGRKRLEIGRALVEARKAWPARGPRAKGWGDFLRDAGIEERSARDWMALAGYVERKISEPEDGGSEIPPRREVQEARKRERDLDRLPAPRLARKAVDDDASDDVVAVERELAPSPQVTIHAQAGATVQVAAMGGAQVTVRGAGVALDATGRPLPPAVATVFSAVVPRLDRLRALAAEMAREWDVMLAALRAGGDLPPGEILQPLLAQGVADGSALRAIGARYAQARPHAVCGYCKGTDPTCTACGGRWWMTASEWAQVPADIQESDRPAVPLLAGPARGRLP